MRTVSLALSVCHFGLQCVLCALIWIASDRSGFHSYVRHAFPHLVLLFGLFSLGVLARACGRGWLEVVLAVWLVSAGWMDGSFGVRPFEFAGQRQTYWTAVWEMLATNGAYATVSALLSLAGWFVADRVMGRPERTARIAG